MDIMAAILPPHVQTMHRATKERHESESSRLEKMKENSSKEEAIEEAVKAIIGFGNEEVKETPVEESVLPESSQPVGQILFDEDETSIDPVDTEVVQAIKNLMEENIEPEEIVCQEQSVVMDVEVIKREDDEDRFEEQDEMEEVAVVCVEEQVIKEEVVIEEKIISESTDYLAGFFSPLPSTTDQELEGRKTTGNDIKKVDQASPVGKVDQHEIECKDKEEDEMAEEKLPEEKLLEEKLPEEKTMEVSKLEESMPEERMPEERMPEERMPEESMPEEKIPGVKIPKEKSPEEKVLHKDNIICESVRDPLSIKDLSELTEQEVFSKAERKRSIDLDGSQVEPESKKLKMDVLVSSEVAVNEEVMSTGSREPTPADISAAESLQQMANSFQAARSSSGGGHSVESEPPTAAPAGPVEACDHNSPDVAGQHGSSHRRRLEGTLPARI